MKQSNKYPDSSKLMTLRRLLEIMQVRGDNLEEVLDYPLVIGITDSFGNFEQTSLTENWPSTQRAHDEFKGQVRLDGYLNNTGFRNIKKSG